MSNQQSVWETLSKIDVSEHVEKKGRFSYLSWAWAWATLKKNYPGATFTKNCFHTGSGDPVPYMKDTEGYAYVAVTVTVEGVEATEMMPVLDHKNKPIKNPNSFDVNTALQRTLVKAIAFHGLGMYIYAGEDLPPEDEKNPQPQTDPWSGYEAERDKIHDLCRETGKSFEEVESWAMTEGTPEAAIKRLEAALKKQRGE